MKKSWRAATKVSLVAVIATLAASPAVPQQGSGTVARYEMDAGTTSGMAAMGAGGGVGAALGMLRGGGGQVSRELVLRLGSTRTASDPNADHFMPDGARLGRSVPLVTPRQVRSEPAAPGLPQGQMEMPRGRLLLFWGCGERASAGQPVVLDFSKMARGEMPPGLFAQAVNLPEAWSVHQGNSATYGDWPNSRDSKPVPANASLLGAHRVAGNYSPEIAFTLADDFMAPLQTSGRDLASGAVNLSWNALPKATGYYAWAMAAATDGGDSRDMVWWASSSTQQFAGALADWLSPAAVARLVEAGTVMPPSQTSCTIPAEVREAGGPMLMTWLYGYGPQADFAYPPRPADARSSWTPEWIARVRFRSSTMAMLGVPGMGGFDGGEERAGQSQSQPQGKPPCPRGLRGIAERAAGLCE
jgi:hypothetical protein